MVDFECQPKWEPWLWRWLQALDHVCLLVPFEWLSGVFQPKYVWVDSDCEGV